MSETDEVCNNCKRNIPAANVDLHHSHCVKNLRLCTLCDDPIPIREFEEHVKEEHGEVECNKCKAKFRQGEEQLHTRVCPMAEINCEYCELEVPRRDIVSHLNACGSRTDTCDTCQERVMLKEMIAHVCRPRVSERAGRLATTTTSVTRTSTSLYALQQLSNNLYQGEGLSHSTEIGADYLDELIATEHFNPLNGSAVDLDAALAAQLAHDESHQTQNHETTRPPASTATSQRPRPNGHSQSSVLQGSMLPCEFCEAMLPIDELILHQSGCLENSISVDNPAPPQLDLLNGRYDSYIPCEFCCRQFPLSVITQHQAGCTPTRRVPSYTKITDERPIRPAPNLAPRPTDRPAPTATSYRPLLSSSKKRVPGKSAVRGAGSSSVDNQPSEHKAGSLHAAPSTAGTRGVTRELVPKPKIKMILPGAGKEPQKVKNTRVSKTNNMNDLGKASSSKAVPSIVIPKRRPGAHVGRAGTNNSSSDNNSTEPWITSPKIINKNPPHRASTTNGAPQNGRKDIIINGRENTGRSGDMNNFSGANKKSASGKDIRINVSTSENRRARENLLSKYQRDKTFAVSNTKSDETS